MTDGDATGIAQPGGAVLVAGVGYFNQRDLSLGPYVVPRLAAETWPDGVLVEDLSYGPVAVVHRLNEADPPFGRLIAVGAVDRGRSEPSPTAYRWDRVLPPPDEIQERIGQALSGVVDLTNLLVVCEQFGALPAEVLVIEAQPVDTHYGLEPGDAMRSVVDEVCALARRLALAPSEELADLPVGPSAVVGLTAAG